MGEVYKATDTRLRRTVALKLIRDGLVEDKERVRRFESEARAAAALDHPNILTVHDVGTHDGAPYIVSELLEGETLAALLEGGALPVRKAIDIGLQIARGLAAAHDKGIVHRDLKPSNLWLTRDGRAKILDFGLAKLSEPDPGSAGERVDRTTSTSPGTVVGTIGYMSPEQVRGEALDARSDIFALGAVLYELLSGRRAFEGQTSADVMSAILRQDPAELSQTGSAIPASLDRIVRRCLEKKPDQRFRSVHDLAFALDALSAGLAVPSDMDGIAAALSQPGARRALAWAGGSLVLVAAGALAFLSRDVMPPVSRPAAGLRVVPLTSLSGAESDPALSPDGKRLAFCWDGDGEPGLYVKRIGGDQPVRVGNGPAGVFSPTWSPDGREIAFLRHAEVGKPHGDEIVVVPAAGGSERRLATSRADNHGLDWSPDGRLLAFVDKASAEAPDAIHLLTIETGERRRLTTPPGLGDYQPTFSPDGRSVAFIRRGDRVAFSTVIYVQEIGSSNPRPVTFGYEIRDVAWAADGGSLVFVAGRPEHRNLWIVDAAGGKARGLSEEHNVITISTARGSQELAFERRFNDSNVWRGNGPAALRTGPPQALLRSPRWDAFPDYSPDGRRIAFASARAGGSIVWTCADDGNDCLEFKAAGLAAPRWSPDGHSIAAAGWQGDGPLDVYRLEVAGRFVRRLTTDNAMDTNPSWSRDGRWLYFSSNRTGTFELWKMPSTGGDARQLTKRGGAIAHETSDGRWIYFTDRFPFGSLWRMPAEGGDETLVLDTQIQASKWALWQDRIIYMDERPGPEHQVVMLDPKTRRSTRLASLGKVPSGFGLAVSPDGAWILYTQDDQVIGDILMLERFQ